MTTIVTLAQTCGACPEQYEGTTDDGQYIYLRHRHGYGRLSIGPTLDDAICAGWLPARGRELLVWHDDEWDGVLRPGALPHIFYAAGLGLSTDVAAQITERPDADDFISLAAELGIHLEVSS